MLNILDQNLLHLFITITTVSLVILEGLMLVNCALGTYCGTELVAFLKTAVATMQPGLPWFYRKLPQAAKNGDIEARICRDQHFNDEDLPVEQLELYVH